MKSKSRFVFSGARILLGLIFFVFGLNGFLGFIPQPPAPERAAAFMGALAATGYMFPLIKGVEVVGGAMLLSNRFVPLALIIVAPNIVNIVLFHALLAPGGLGIAFLVLALELTMAWVASRRFCIGAPGHGRLRRTPMSSYRCQRTRRERMS